MLGWLGFEFSVNQWLAAQAQPRSLAYLIIALGLVVGRQRVSQLQRARERDLAETRANALAQANDLKTTFLAKVSHELRTPLQSFLGYTEIMLADANPRDRERLSAMREHAGLMSRLVNDLIDISAAECGQFQLVERPIALAELVRQAAESLRPSAESKGLAYTISTNLDVPPGLLADLQRVRQVVLNLIGNAVKYTDRGRVDVVLACPEIDASSATIEMRVTDTGPGIPTQLQAEIFSAFSRLTATAGREGSGLGLAIVAAVSHAMGGDATVVSDGRTGSTFTARWRLRICAAPAPTASGKVPLHGKKILVVDDNALVRDLFIVYLNDCGANCTAAGDGAEAIERLRVEPFDAVVLDLAMPRLDGLATVRQLRSDPAHRHRRIVGVSAHAGGAEHRDALAAGMDVFLTKPVALPDLARSLAPATAWIPPEPAFASMRAHFERRFRTDARTQSTALSAALAKEDWPNIERAAHHLHNSAGVIGDTELARACAALESAAHHRDPMAATAAWVRCTAALARWLAEPAGNQAVSTSL
jgi:signal transduction histidine kinase/CheY-like chemotaxis protein